MEVVLLKNSACIVRSVRGNGDCLFASMAHQIFNYELESDEHVSMTAALRVMVVDHIRNHADDTELALAIRLRMEEEHPELLGRNEAETVQNFLRLLADTVEPREWGGAESLSALAQIFSCVILVKREGDCHIEVTSPSSDISRVFSVVYRGPVNEWNHYDSLYLSDRFSSNEPFMISDVPDQLIQVRGGQCSIHTTHLDENSLFSALAHQLFPCRFLSNIHLRITAQVRKLITLHLLQHLDDPEYTELLNNRASTSCPHSIGLSLQEERRRFLHLLSHPATPGGIESIEAFSRLFCCSVMIYWEQGPITYTSASLALPHRQIRLVCRSVYGQYDHYDSFGAFVHANNSANSTSHSTPH